MLVSVIMPAFNAARYIEQAIRSLFIAADGLRLDIIVVDDGSSDATREVVANLARRHPEIRLIAAPHSGISVTRNRGLDALPPDARFVTFHDADDIAYPGRIARQLALLEANPNAQVVYGMLQFFDLLDDVALLPSPQARTMTMRTIQLSSALYRREALDRVGRFDESLVQAEDTDFLFRLVESGACVLMEDDVATFYRRHDTNTTRDVLGARHDFMKAIHKSVTRRRATKCGVAAPLASSMFAQRGQFEEMFETCTPDTP